MVSTGLIKYEAMIREIQPGEQSISYYAETWKRHLGKDEGLERLIQSCPRQVTRGDLFKMAVAAKDSGEGRDLCRLFVGVMAWGYGTGGRGAWRTAKMIATPGYMELIKRTFDQIIEGKILESYRGFLLNWCGPAYFTKYFYFIGRGCGVSGYPLILDSRVKNALEIIGIDLRQFVKPSGWYPEGYYRYVQAMHEWAGDLGCDADQIEYFLFKMTG
jgi:hypothetical protein